MRGLVQSWLIFILARGRWPAGLRGSRLKRQGARSKVSEQPGYLALLGPWTSNMGGRDDGKVAGATILTRHRDRDDVVGGQPLSVDIHDPAASSDAAIVVEDRSWQRPIQHQAAAVRVQHGADCV